MTVETGVTLFQITFWIYLAATVCYIAYLVREQSVFGKAGTALLVAGMAAHIGSVLARGFALGRAPFLNLYEYLLCFTLGAAIVYLVVEHITRNRSIGAFGVSLVTMFAYLTVRLPSDVNPTMPALRSAWRVPHISTAVFAYAAFTLAFGLAVMYLLRDTSGRKKYLGWTKRLPKTEMLDKLIYRVIAFGFMMQTAMIITGAIWAQIAWGRYWGWDPKETWALITWLIYATFLHTRTTMGWRGRRSALLAIIGFAATVFTLIGVSYLLSGLHSYAK